MAAGAIVLGIIGGVVYWERQRLVQWYVDARFAAAQRRCLKASLPSNTLVARATRSKEDHDAVLRDPAFFASRLDLKPPMFAAYRRWGDEQSLSELGANAIEGPFDDEGLLFLHELRKPNGQRRLVRVGVWCLSYGAKQVRFYISMRTAVYTVADFGQRPSQLGGWTKAIGDNDPFGPANDIRFFAGEVDDKDPGLLRIAVEVDGRRGAILGKLTENDEIEMSTVFPQP